MLLHLRAGLIRVINNIRAGLIRVIINIPIRNHACVLYVRYAPASGISLIAEIINNIRAGMIRVINK